MFRAGNLITRRPHGRWVNRELSAYGFRLDNIYRNGPMVCPCVGVVRFMSPFPIWRGGLRGHT